MKGELRSRCFEAYIYTEYTLVTPFATLDLSFACASLPYVQQNLSRYLHIQLNTLNRLIYTYNHAVSQSG